jgi:hypothetical protein
MVIITRTYGKNRALAKPLFSSSSPSSRSSRDATGLPGNNRGSMGQSPFCSLMTGQPAATRFACNSLSSAVMRSMSDEMARFRDILDPLTHVTGPQPVGNGGELVVATQEAMNNIPGIIETLRQSPDMVNALASRERLELASAAGEGTGTDVLTLAVDAADTIKARNSLEKMLAHQLAAMHALAMKFSERAQSMLRENWLRPQ